jgi:hypothetical protein
MLTSKEIKGRRAMRIFFIVLLFLFIAALAASAVSLASISQTNGSRTASYEADAR